MNIRNFSFRKDGWHVTLSNGCIFLGCLIGNCIKGDFIPVLILTPFVILMFTLSYMAYKYGK